MKILHTADWHLGKRLESFSRLEEQREVMNEICNIADREAVDAVIVAGDLFDTFNPSTEAVDLFYKTLKKLARDGKRAVICIAGNHDSPDRIEAPDPLARECGILFAGFPHTRLEPFELESGLKVIRSEEGFAELQLPGCPDRLRLLLTPYASEYRLKTYLGNEDTETELRKVLQDRWAALAEKYCDPSGVNVLLTHLFMIKNDEERPEEPEDEKPILHVGGAQAVYTGNIPAGIQYTALGHLHRRWVVDTKPGTVAYSGSPLSYSFSEANQSKYVMIAEIHPGQEAVVKEVELTSGRKLLRKKAGSMEEAVKWLRENQGCLVELTLITDNYLTAAERKELQQMHDGIVTIIPEVKNKELIRSSNGKNIDLSKNTEELFTDYFKHVKGQAPNKRLLDLFREVLAEEKED